MTEILPRRELVLGGLAVASLAGCRNPEGDLLPDVSLPGLPDLLRNGWPVPGIAAGQFRRRVSVLNVWASWCPYCRGEHGELMRLSQDGRFRLVGLVFQDRPQAASDYLRRAGNPFDAVATDPDRVLTGALGQRGVPSSYVVDRSGRVTLRMAGALDAGSVRDRLKPAIAAALDAVPG